MPTSRSAGPTSAGSRACPERRRAPSRSRGRVNDPLSIRAAAQDAGERIALRVDGRGYSFAELAARVAPRIDALPSGRGPVPVAGVNTLETLLTLLRAA